METNTRFAEELELDYVILSDPKKDVAKAYGVVHGERKVPERWTFIIDKEGKIAFVDREVKAADHAKAVLEKLEELDVAKREKKEKKDDKKEDKGD